MRLLKKWLIVQGTTEWVLSLAVAACGSYWKNEMVIICVKRGEGEGDFCPNGAKIEKVWKKGINIYAGGKGALQ